MIKNLARNGLFSQLLAVGAIQMWSRDSKSYLPRQSVGLDVRLGKNLRMPCSKYMSEGAHFSKLGYIIQTLKMHTTKVFRNGNSQAVRIPIELAYERTDLVMQIERIGDEIRIRPVRRSLAEVMKRFAKFSRDFMAGGRGKHVQDERNTF